jgi:hypothetical protein
VGGGQNQHLPPELIVLTMEHTSITVAEDLVAAMTMVIAVVVTVIINLKGKYSMHGTPGQV